MYVKVRTMDGSQMTVLTISKLTTVEEFRCLVEEKFDAPPERQRLFYRGKQMEDGYNLFDYNVNINDVIQLMVKPVFQELTNTSPKKSSPKVKTPNIDDKENAESPNGSNIKEEESVSSEFYRVGDLVDAKYQYDGTWWEAKITKISINTRSKKRSELDDGLSYYVQFERYKDLPDDEVKIEHLRPRAKLKVPFENVKLGQILMVNYNVEDPPERGFWYDCKVTKIVNTKKERKIIGTVYLADKLPLAGCHITLVDELFRIEKTVPLKRRTKSTEELINCGSPIKRQSGPNCSSCKDIPRKKCKECGCLECGGKENPDKQLMCDECDHPYHIYCLDPPLEEIPDVEEWFCPECKNDDTEIVRAGERLKASKKKANMASAKGKTNRDWGKGFACAGRQKICDIVPQNHFGPIPGVEVGTLWKFRLQASEAGVHRPHVAGIHGRENEGAYSIVLAGGYEDDEDRGDEFTYTGSGGRDLSGNKRTAEQSSDQLLTRMNKALALNCNTPLNKTGAEAKDWRKGKPVRVIRSYKGRNHSDFAPEEGIRYDGIYKIVKYWQAPGQSGFKVWRYLLKRDDPSPAPWTKDGKLKIKELGLTLQYPDGYLEAMKHKNENGKPSHSDSDDESEAPKKKGKKRKVEKNVSSVLPLSKKQKSNNYTIQKNVLDLINKDTANEKLWEQYKKVTELGKTEFLKVVEDGFLCVCCQSLVQKPITTPCFHNICLQCLQRSFKAEVYTCPSCRYDLGEKYSFKSNELLQSILQFLFPGYDVRR